VGDPPRWPRDTLLSAEVGTKFRHQVAVDRIRLQTKGHGVCFISFGIQVLWVMSPSSLIQKFSGKTLLSHSSIHKGRSASPETSVHINRTTFPYSYEDYHIMC
jgi:hypothetical protein